MPKVVFEYIKANKELYKDFLATLRSSITRKLLVVVFSIYIILTAVVTILHMEFEYSSSKRQTIEALENIQQMSEGSLSQALWEINYPQIESILEGIYSSKFLVGVDLLVKDADAMSGFPVTAFGKIEDSSGQVFIVNPDTKKQVPVDLGLEQLIPYKFNIYHMTEINDKQKLAELVLYSSNKIVFNQVKESYFIIIFNAAIKTLALWLFFLWAGYKYISRPLKKLTNAIKNLSNGHLNSKLALHKFTSEKKTEINMLIDSFNEMSEKISTTQNELNNTNKRLYNIFDTIPSALISVDKNGVVLGWNRYIENEIGILANDAIGKNITDVYPPLKYHMRLIAKSIEDNANHTINNTSLENKEDNRLYNIGIYPIPNSIPPEAVIRIDDVTESLRNQADMAQIEKLASVGALIAGVTHEINNPLGSIMQGSQNILRRLKPDLPANAKVAEELSLDLEKQYEYLKRRDIIKFVEGIKDSAERATSIVKNMLKFTRQSSFEFTRNNVIQLIEDAIELAATDYNLQKHFDFKQVNINRNFCCENVDINCSPGEIQQVLLNLLKNSAQAFKAEQPNKEITVNVTQNDKHVLVEIADNGSGIPDKVKEKIFKPFFTTKPEGVGTGLGLSVCRDIISRHNGTMELESVEHIGTKFILKFPNIN